MESILGDIGKLSGMTFEILKDTNVGKAVNKLSRLGKLHPSIIACDHIALKARSKSTSATYYITLPGIHCKLAHREL